MSNPIVQKGKPKFSQAIQTATFQNLIKSTLSDPQRASRFTASIVSAVATNPALQECDAGSILSAALLGESLELPASPQLGYYYLVPYKDTRAGVTKATFQLGYRGMIQLAMRSGHYTRLDVVTVKEGEIKKIDRLKGIFEFEEYPDRVKRETLPTAGYFAAFEYENGFKKEIFWYRDEMEAHAARYSASYRSDKKYGSSKSFWASDFDQMAEKTMLRQLISKWGIMSVQVARAIEADEKPVEVHDGGDFIVQAIPHDEDKEPHREEAPPPQTDEAPIPDEREAYSL